MAWSDAARAAAAEARKRGAKGKSKSSLRSDVRRLGIPKSGEMHSAGKDKVRVVATSYEDHKRKVAAVMQHIRNLRKAGYDVKMGRVDPRTGGAYHVYTVSKKR